MRENDEALFLEQQASAVSFIEDVYEEVKKRIGGHCTMLCGNDGLPYEISFDTVDAFSVTIIGSDTNNGDCFTSMLCFDGSAPYLSFSDRMSAEAYKSELIDFLSAIAGHKLKIAERVKSHKSRVIEFFVYDGGELKCVRSDTKQKGFAAALLLWKNRYEEKLFDLSFK